MAKDLCHEAVKVALAKEALRKCQALAEKASISEMTLEEIKAVRNAKNNS